MLKEFTVRQSFGLPVGSDFARLIAEAVLVDTDEALLREGYDFTRYVDDVVIFIKPGQDPYGALSFLAEHLAKCEGLSLSSQKTRIYEASKYLENLQLIEDAENDDDAAEALIRSEFLDISGGDDQLDFEKIEKISQLDLPELLKEAVDADIWDPSKIKILLRALKIVKSTACVSYIKENFVTLLPFAKDVVLLMEELHNAHPGIFAEMREGILEILSQPTCQALPVVRAWIFEIFIRGVCPFYSSDFRRLPWSTETLDRRQIILLSHAANDVAYFRSRKTRLSELNSWEIAPFIYGATCLPRDEYEVWIQGTRKIETFALSDIFYNWCLGINKARVFDPALKAPARPAPTIPEAIAF